MPPRQNNQITMMIAQARQKLNEIKGVQYFGGDALNLSKFEQTFTQAGGAGPKCWRITMTPTRPGYTIPIDATTKPAAENSFSWGSIERVPTTDGTFQYLLYFDTNYGTDPNTCLFTVTYSGAATFDVTVIA